MMFLKVDLKRKLLAIALTMVMAISCLFGVLFIRVNAAEIAISDLVTVSGDAIVKGVPQQYVMKNDGDDGTLAGTSVGDTGLYIESTKADSAGYTVALNGIFTGSTGMMLAFPGEGFWNGQMRSVIITVSSLSDPNETFDILFEGEWGMNATVAYEWEGQTLYRSRSQYNGNNYDSTTGEEDQVWRYQKAEHFFYPAAGCYNTAGTTADPRRTASYLGLEMTEEGALNVIFMANTNWGGRSRNVRTDHGCAGRQHAEPAAPRFVCGRIHDQLCGFGSGKRQDDRYADRFDRIGRTARRIHERHNVYVE